MNMKLTLFLNPFVKIAGVKALLWGLTGMIVSVAVAYYSDFHYHGLMHFGAAPNDSLLCYAVEHAVVWIIPALIFYIGGLILSKSNIRIVDVAGTVAFAQLPFILMNLFFLLPPMQQLNRIDFNLPPMEILKQPDILFGLWLSLVSVIFLVWVLVWMFNALKISCNLKGKKLGILYAVAVIGGDVACRFIINLFY
ncbi:MAG: YIP1 family protein [Tannerellaceae bacterium]|jgi:hypothetical protein|nr:YIP1 family protein [Tannerellaceae bacterium]